MAKRIKILYTIPNFDTAGSGKVVYDLVKGLDKTVFEPEICCFHNRGTYFQTIETLGVKTHIFNFTAPYRPKITFPFRVLKIYKFFKTHQFDVIHSWHWSSDISEPLAAKLAGVPFIYTKKAMGWRSRYWKWRSQLSTKIITINEDMVRQYFSGMMGKIEKIPLGIDTNIFQPNSKFNLNRESLDLKTTDFVVITVANLVAVKGIEILIQAIKVLNQDRIKLLIVGDYNNTYGNVLKAEYECDSILFFGKQLDVRPYLAIADVFVIPTKNEGRKEGLPIAPIEAMAQGKIVIGSNISGIKDVLSPFPDQLFEADNVDDLKRKLVRILHLNEGEKSKLGMQMAEHVQNNYNIIQFVEKHEALYKKLIK